jgi:transposase InsO family protein
MARAGIDLTGPWPRSNNNTYILTFIDHFTKWAAAVPIPTKDAETVAKALVSNIFTQVGCVLQLLSDQGKEFDNLLMTSLCHLLGTDKIRTTSYKASTNASAERLHRSMNSMIAKCVDENQRNWSDVLPHVMAAYRSAVHESTGFSPNFLFYGRELYAPIDLLTQPPPAEKTVEDFVDEVEHNIRYAHQLARECLQSQAARRKKYYDMRVNFTSFQKHDWVWYFYPRRVTGRSPKWQRLYTGPFLVTEKLGPVNYIIQRSAKADPIVVHVDKLKAYEGDTPKSWLLSQATSATVPAPDLDITGTRESPDVIIPPFTDDQVVHTTPTVNPTRDRRPVKPPAWLSDFSTY